jgi:membrane fusion protein, multidrug efflux system
MAEHAPIAATAATSPRTTVPEPALHEPRAAKASAASPAPSSGGGKAIAVALVLVIICVALGAMIVKNQKKPAVRVPPPVTISTTNAVRGSIDEIVWALGTVTPIYTAMISPRVDGQIVRVNYTEGQLVTTNDMLAEIDPGPYQALLTQAQGQLARDQAQLEGAKIDLGRYQDAYTKKAIPKQQVDDQLALVHQDEGTVKFDEGQVTNSSVQLAYCYIRAPFSGRAGLRLIDPGNVVHAANTNPLVVIAQLQPITVIFSPGEDYLPAIQRQLQAGHNMTVEAWDRDQKEKLATGTFLTLDNLIDTATGTIRIKALFDNDDMSLFPNQFVNAKLIINTLSNVTLIPTAAIQRNPQGAFVFVVTNQTVNVTNQGVVETTNMPTVVMQTITPVVTDADTSSVKGIRPGTIIATDNFNKLGDGMVVRLRQSGGGGQRGGGQGGKRTGGKSDKSQENAQ